jgi:hypothetical protein
MKGQLISSSSSTTSEDENDTHQLTINEHYAKAFQHRKEREELAKRTPPRCCLSHTRLHLADLFLFFFFIVPSCLQVKEKYGSDADTDNLDAGDSDSESDESEDEDGEELTPALDAAILRTLARIKARDPGIYDTDRHVFEGTTFIFTSSPPPSSSTHNPIIDRGARQVWIVIWPLSNEEGQSAQARNAPGTTARRRTRCCDLPFRFARGVLVPATDPRRGAGCAARRDHCRVPRRHRKSRKRGRG